MKDSFENLFQDNLPDYEFQKQLHQIDGELNKSRTADEEFIAKIKGETIRICYELNHKTQMGSN